MNILAIGAHPDDLELMSATPRDISCVGNITS